MRNIKVVIEYDGTDFHGFQRLPNSPTIQGALEDKLSQITKESVRVIGAGRTDAGVHAAGQVINFMTDCRIPVNRVSIALNSLPPYTIVARNAEEMPLEFNSRRNAWSRVYRYTILNQEEPSAFLGRFSYRFPKSLNLGKMCEAAEVLVGTHDFSSFCAAGSEVVSPVRRIDRLEVVREGPLIQVICEANGFLRSMVRNIMGALLEAGQEKLNAEGMRKILQEKNRCAAPAKVPAQGLCLMKVNY